MTDSYSSHIMHNGRLLLPEDRLLEHPDDELDLMANAAAMAMSCRISGREISLLLSDQIISSHSWRISFGQKSKGEIMIGRTLLTELLSTATERNTRFPR